MSLFNMRSTQYEEPDNAFLTLNINIWSDFKEKGWSKAQQIYLTKSIIRCSIAHSDTSKGF
ncbi:hypothetical protein BpHYR1_014015 [Brachionus plicatilis]|uniref:Uncharacterized protein n=1 Tax=Brachionus plicatilis TaxID=10195 RepID=A0A3M7QT59_BRAPC|nr:hypothetical protein BpHYR1_014015 [Brachionus plicatilis]